MSEEEDSHFTDAYIAKHLQLADRMEDFLGTDSPTSYLDGEPLAETIWVHTIDDRETSPSCELRLFGRFSPVALETVNETSDMAEVGEPEDSSVPYTPRQQSLIDGASSAQKMIIGSTNGDSIIYVGVDLAHFGFSLGKEVASTGVTDALTGLTSASASVPSESNTGVTRTTDEFRPVWTYEPSSVIWRQMQRAPRLRLDNADFGVDLSAFGFRKRSGKKVRERPFKLISETSAASTSGEEEEWEESDKDRDAARESS